jgi:cyclopropane fatty-acyl-phospholipid synthase-like methyltransferase
VPPFVRAAGDIAGTPFDRSRELGWVTRHVQSGRLVDVGCSWGYAMLQAAAAGFEVRGTELSRNLARVARERFSLDVEEKELADLRLEDGALDAVLAVHSIQHFLDPRGFFAEAQRVLAPGGVLVGAVPNFDGFLRELLGRRFRWLDPECQPHHFRPAPLARELEGAGFAVEVWTSEGLYGEQAVLECLSPEEAADMSRQGRGSEIGFIAVKR